MYACFAVESARKAEKGDDELEQVAGTAEDEIGDAISHIRERELLFGDGSLLATFGPLLTHVCANNTIYHVRMRLVLQYSMRL